ncbi:MAG: OadG family protein [Bacteroidales bacterium]|nr:OadG family protein [Bacteroidales bacterium]
MKRTTKRILFPLVILLLGGLQAMGQNVIDLKITEVLAEPDSLGFMDDYGQRNGWVEVTNTSYGTVNMGGCFFTDDKNNLKKSIISKNDLATQIGKRQVVVFHGTGDNSQGTFYLNFKIRRGSTIYLVSNDGRTIVDSIAVPANLPVGKSISKFANDNKKMKFIVDPNPSSPTPGSMNGDANAESNAQKIAKNDPHGFILSLTSISVVFSALAILWFLFWILFERPAKKKKEAAAAALLPKKTASKPGTVTPEVAAAIGMALDLDTSGEVYAAIATALHLYLSESVHDAESYTITIKPSEGAWKTHGQTFRRLPKAKK